MHIGVSNSLERLQVNTIYTGKGDRQMNIGAQIYAHGITDDAVKDQIRQAIIGNPKFSGRVTIKFESDPHEVIGQVSLTLPCLHIISLDGAGFGESLADILRNKTGIHATSIRAEVFPPRNANGG